MKKIPLILAGYSPGQPDVDRMSYEMSPQLLYKTDWAPPGFRENGLFDQNELAKFWNPLVYPPNTNFPRLLAPFHAWDYSQTQILKEAVVF